MIAISTMITIVRIIIVIGQQSKSLLKFALLIIENPLF